MRRSLLSMAVMCLLASSTNASAEELQACVARNGRLYLIGDNFQRQECRRNHMALTIISALPSPAPQTRELHLYDANGQDLGILTSQTIPWPTGLEGSMRYFTTYLPDLDAQIAFEMHLHSTEPQFVAPLFEPGTGDLFFTDSACQGTPYIIEPNNARYLPYILRDQFGADFLYVRQNPLAPAEDLAMNSFASESGCSQANFPRRTFFPVEYVDLPFSLPIAWPLTVSTNSP